MGPTITKSPADGLSSPYSNAPQKQIGQIGQIGRRPTVPGHGRDLDG